MKIVSIQELMVMPAGTVFTKYDEGNTSGLFRKEENCDYAGSVDFFYRDLVPFCFPDESVPTIGVKGRWGMFDHEERFVILDQRDRDGISELLQP